MRLLRGRGLAALLMLLAMALMARALPAEEFGLLMLLHAFVLGVYGLVNLKPFEAVVLYGARDAKHLRDGSGVPRRRRVYAYGHSEGKHNRIKLRA